MSDSDKKFKLEAGYLYIIPSYTLCDLTCTSFLSQYFVQFFEESLEGESLFPANPSILKVKASEVDVINFRRLIEINPGRGINRSDNPQVYEKHVYYKEYQQLNNHQNLSVFLETQGILLQFISRFTLPEIFKKKRQQFIPEKILDAMRFVQANLHLPLTVASLAERANQNAEYFSRTFEAHTGTRPLAYITQKRVERAQHMIGASRHSYESIAELTGFKSLSNFSRTFKRVTGLSPSAYKRRINSSYSN
ncbi:helix-turn-helix domain-containing protein [Mucilaginibacter calamicampi]|uniref:helix-turn-helix domain-containing protein n=1 Tax=Mucilaginibacter calamicampi TaxID=1302352 RepID=UPI003672BC45